MKKKKGSCLAMLIFIAVVICICGAIGSVCQPYIWNTWVIDCAGVDPDSSEWLPMSKGTGFCLGLCPVIGQLSIPGVIVTGVCDLIFIEDEPRVEDGKVDGIEVVPVE